MSPFPHLAAQNKHYKTFNQSSFYSTLNLLSISLLFAFRMQLFNVKNPPTLSFEATKERKKLSLCTEPEKSIQTKSPVLTISIFAPSRHFSPIWPKTQSRPGAQDRDRCGDSEQFIYEISVQFQFLKFFEEFMKCADLIFFGQCLLWKSCANVEKIKPVSKATDWSINRLKGHYLSSSELKCLCNLYLIFWSRLWCKNVQ